CFQIVPSRPVLSPMTSVLGSLASGMDEAASKNFPGTASLMSVNVTVCACALAAASSRAAITVTVLVLLLVMCALPCPISGSWRLRHLLCLHIRADAHR